MTERKTAGELSIKAYSDNTDYNALELGHAVTDNVGVEVRQCIENHREIFDEDEFCIVRQSALDPIISNAKRFKFYAWLYLPSPRPDQTVWLYNKRLDTITKRLWSLPSAARMAQLASTSCIVPKEYQTMQAWSVAFFKGVFWDYVRYDQKIDMLSEHEYFLAHREELIAAGCQVVPHYFVEPFDFGKVSIKNIVDTEKPALLE